MLLAESTDELKEKVLRWKEYMETKELKMNITIIKVMVYGKNCVNVERTGKWLSVGRNSIRCRGRAGWSMFRRERLTKYIRDAFGCKLCEKADNEGNNKT